MKEKKPISLRTHLLSLVLLCWVLPILSVTLLAGYLLGRSYEQASRQELDSRAQNAVEQLAIRMDAVFDASKAVSYDGVVRNSYRLYQLDGDSAALYRTITDYLNTHFTRDERVLAVFLSFWNDEIGPYAASRGDLGYSAQRIYREEVEADLLEKVKDLDTGILLLEYGGELYVARNLVDSHFRPYASVVLLCDDSVLFQSVDAVQQVSSAELILDGKLLYGDDRLLHTVENREVSSDHVYEKELSGHTVCIEASLAPFRFWKDIPQIQTTALLVLLLVFPLLAVMLYLFRRQVTKPVEILVDASNRLQAGERGYKIETSADSREFYRLFEHFNEMSAELKNQFDRSVQEQQALQQAQVKALQLQINPHFLNNTLEIINWEARLANDTRASSMLEALSVMMNGTLGRDGRSRIPLREELTYVDAYLYIIRERLGERLTITREIDENMLDTQVPRLILQPIVENAVEHDLTPRRGGQLSIRARQENGFVILEVEHDGHMTQEDLATIDAVLSSPVEDTGISGQIGLRNVRQRLTLLYGDQGTIRLTQPEVGRILARVSFPLS
ncbi:MAG: histidine kinase [Oscillospiraceae bacterium]|nr:histidine kinase [Oscillospiraceae bacterium]